MTREARRRYTATERPLFSPCCCRPTALFGVADELGGVHWCPCGMPWRMRDLVTAEAFTLRRHVAGDTAGG